MAGILQQREPVTAGPDPSIIPLDPLSYPFLFAKKVLYLYELYLEIHSFTGLKQNKHYQVWDRNLLMRETCFFSQRHTRL